MTSECTDISVMRVKFTYKLGLNLETSLLLIPGRDHSVTAAEVSNNYQVFFF